MPPSSPSAPAPRSRLAASEHALRQAQLANQHLSVLVQHLPEGLLLLDAAGTVVFVNEAYCQLLDVPGPASQWLNQPLDALQAPMRAGLADPAACFELPEPEAGPVSVPSARLPLRNGRVLVRDLQPVPLGAGAGWLLRYRDVPAPRADEAHLLEGGRLSDQNPHPVLRLNAAGERVYANPAARQLFDGLLPTARRALLAQLGAAAATGLREGQPQQVEMPAGPHLLQAFVAPFPAEGGVNLYLVDITARHAAEQQVREQRAFYEDVLNELPSQIAVLDAEHRYQFLNAHAVPDPPARQQLLGRSFYEYAAQMGWPVAVADNRQHRLAEALQTRRPVVWQEASPRPDGSTAHYLRRFQPVFGAGGELRFLIGHGTDITDRVEAEERVQARDAQLQEEQRFTQLVLDTAPSAIYVRDAAGHIVFANRAMQALSGAMKSLPARAAAHPAGPEAWEMAQYARADAQVLATGQEVTAEDRLTLGPGDVRWFHTVKRPLPGPGGLVQVLGVSTDITATKQAQFSLAHTEKQYRDLARYSQALMCTHDLQGTMLSVSPAVAQLMGAPAEALVGRSLRDGVPPARRPQVAAYLALMAQQTEHSGLMQVQAASGEIRYLLYHNYRVQEDGQTTHVVGYGQDITARIQAEQATKRARDEAEATARAREHFLANMSHEIRTPMNGVLGMTAQLAKTRLDARQQEFVRVIQRSGEHLLGVLNDVLDMAKITAGQLEFEQVAFNLCDSTSAAVQALALQAQEKGLEFVGIPLRDSCPVPWVMGDAHRLNQILLNLVSNAVKFTDRGRITVRGEMLSETADALTVRFSVEDTGVGIAPDKQAHIFESFTQAYADTARRHGGTGLGLSISRALVAQLGGQLTLSSAVDAGSTFAFTLTLPKAPAEARPATPAADYDTGHLVGARVLLVEDNDINRLVARLMLEPWGVLLDEAPDGLVALERLREQDYDVVLMDIQLPGLNGVEATQRLRQLPDARRAATPVIALTANAFRADVERYLASGFNDYLAKPYEEEALYRKMEALLPAVAGPAYDLAHLRRMAQGRPVFVARIIRSFLTNMPVSLAQMRAAAARADWPAVASLVHHVKPNLLALAVAGTAEPVALLERLHYAASAPGMAPLPAALAVALEQLLAAVERALRQLPAEEEARAQP